MAAQLVQVTEPGRRTWPTAPCTQLCGAVSLMNSDFGGLRFVSTVGCEGIGGGCCGGGA